MENNYPMLFPCPDPSSYSISSGSGVHHGNLSNFEGQKSSSSNGFLNLRAGGVDHHEKSDHINIIHSLQKSNSDDHEEQQGNMNMMINNSGGKNKKGEKKVRKPRYAFQTRSHVDILDDGYRWRKYGQKAVKNNKFPRSYYRCTHQGCNVKKQVQRLTKDEGVVVTTYEGVHTHPIEKTTDNFEHILSQMQIYTPF